MKIPIRGRFNGKIMYTIEAKSLKAAIEEIMNTSGNLSYTNLSGNKLNGIDFFRADLRYADLSGAHLNGAHLNGADLNGTNLNDADLSNAHLYNANLSNAHLNSANLSGAHLNGAHLSGADLYGANLNGADLYGANLSGANLNGAHLNGAKGLVKRMGVEAGNHYWKRFCAGLKNNDFQFYVGFNTLRKSETFASDERVTCSYPGFYFASRSWCAIHYPDRHLEARIRIPNDAQINEPWNTDGKASADSIEIVQVFDTITGKDVTERYRKKEINK